MNMKKLCYILALSATLIACRSSSNSGNSALNADSLQQTIPDSVQFSSKIDNQQVNLYTLHNKKGMRVLLTNFGARIVAAYVPGKDGKLTDVVLGFSKATDYNNPEEPYFGTIVGPFGNRIAKGTFTLNGKTYKLPTNNGPNTLHGGFKGVHFAVWAGKQDGNTVTFTYTLPDGNEGFPGNIEMKVAYSLDENDQLHVDYYATSDKETVINLANHAYFNLNGEGSGSILHHQLQLFADRYTPVDSTLIPTGELAAVKDTPFDFTKGKAIGKDIGAANVQLSYGKGFDHNFVLRGTKVNGLNHAARLTGDQSGIVMDIYTDEPGIQFYSGNFMAEHVTLKNGAKDSFRTGLCLEPQHFPDSPNQPKFPSTVLKPGQKYHTRSIYAFSINK